MFADQDQHRHFDLRKFRTMIEFGKLSTGGLQHVGIGFQEGFAAALHQIGMCGLKFWRKQPAHRDIRDRGQPLGFGRRCHIAEGFLSLWRSVLARSDFSAGCAVVAVTVAAESEDLRTRAAEILRHWREKLATLFVDGGISKKKARALAASLVAACEGGVILARAERSFEPFDLVAAEQLVMIEAAAKSAT